MGTAARVRESEGVTWDDTTRRESSIVCGLDGSDGARLALRVAASLARELDLRLVVAHVVQPQPAARGLGPTAGQLAALPLESLLAAGEALVDSILAEEKLFDVERRVVPGFAADRLADLADDEAAELVVVGSRGRRGFKAAWLGSVSADLVGVARCPVLVVPPGAAPVAIRMGSGAHWRAIHSSALS
jgi:nucleotide-binding universal stress UspA family protein